MLSKIIFFFRLAVTPSINSKMFHFQNFIKDTVGSITDFECDIIPSSKYSKRKFSRNLYNCRFISEAESNISSGSINAIAGCSRSNKFGKFKGSVGLDTFQRFAKWCGELNLRESPRFFALCLILLARTIPFTCTFLGRKWINCNLL